MFFPYFVSILKMHPLERVCFCKRGFCNRYHRAVVLNQGPLRLAGSPWECLGMSWAVRPSRGTTGMSAWSRGRRSRPHLPVDIPTVSAAQAEKPGERAVISRPEVTSRQPQAYGAQLRKAKAPSVTHSPSRRGPTTPPCVAPLLPPTARAMG